MKRIFISAVLFILLSYRATAQERIGFDYDPALELKRQVDKSDFDRKTAQEFYAPMTYYKASLVKSGSLLDLPDIRNYLLDVLSQLGYRNEVKSVEITNHSSPNAYVLSDGSMFVNIGLLAVLDNEAELAFVLSHEVSHIKKEHGRKAFLKSKALAKQEKGQELGVTYMKLKYSRENESEADAAALRHLLTTKYDVNAAINALSKFQDSIYFNWNSKVDFSLMGFKEGDYTASENTDFEIDTEVDVLEDVWDDQWLTHPSLDRRLQALQEMLRLIQQETGSDTSLISTVSYTDIRDEAIRVLISNLHEKSAFGLSLYVCLQAYDRLSDKEFLDGMILKNTYWLAIYKEKDLLENVLEARHYLNYPAYIQYHMWLENLDVKSLKTTLYEHAKALSEKYKSDDIVFYYAMISELQLGKEVAFLLFADYLKNHPNGKYAGIARQKVDE